MDSVSIALHAEVEALCKTAKLCGARGWLPATSGNFSVRDAASGRLLISPSGIDKGGLQPADLLEIDGEGRVLRGAGKSSAETALHVVIYRERPLANAIVHVHTIWNTLLSARAMKASNTMSTAVVLEGYELLKALDGVETHEHRETVPVLRNTQDYAALGEQLARVLHEDPDAHGVLLSAHGIYTWGKSVAEAWRHAEALEFLFELEGRRWPS